LFSFKLGNDLKWVFASLYKYLTRLGERLITAFLLLLLILSRYFQSISYPGAFGNEEDNALHPPWLLRVLYSFYSPGNSSTLAKHCWSLRRTRRNAKSLQRRRSALETVAYSGGSATRYGFVGGKCVRSSSHVGDRAFFENHFPV